jgi:AAA family ATP:ADP antiporter
MIEMGWKAYMKDFFNDPKFYQTTVGMTYSATGLSSLIFSIIFGRSIISKLGWYKSSQLTPIIAAVTTILFCGAFFLDYIYSIPLVIIYLGALHNILLKTMKLSLFDPTREMIYIPLGEDEKTSGKAAIDVFCFRLGKSSSSWVQILLIEFIGFGSFIAAFDSSIVIVALVLFGWFMSIKSLKNEKSFESL